MRAKNRVKQALREGRVSLGLEIMIGSERIIEIAGWSGFEYVQLDQEHTPFGFESIESCVRAAEGVGMSSFVRIPQYNPKDIGRALETGAHGVVIPQVRSAAEVRDAIAAMYYSPHGTRGMCPVTRTARYRDEDWEDYLAWTRSELMLVPLIENKDALAEIEAICAIPEIEIIGFGSGDLGQSLGVGARGMSEPVVREAFAHVAETARRHGVVLKSMPHIGDDPLKSVSDLIDKGIGSIMYDADALMFSRECRRIVKDVGGLLAQRTAASGSAVSYEPKNSR